MNIRRVAFLCVLCALCGERLLSVEASAQASAAAPMSVRYKCDNKQSLQVDYNVPGKTSRAIVTTGKKSWTMKQVSSGSGIRYEDTKKAMEWSSQGAEGHLTDLKTSKSIRCTESATSR
jgi:membrane-bound inhibitor of C-type lysozyme